MLRVLLFVNTLLLAVGLVGQSHAQDEGHQKHNLIRAARRLAWMRRVEAGHRITIGCLGIGPVRVLHMPGELFVEYQRAAQKMWPDLFVCMAAYGDHGPGYIGTAVAYEQGGYEVGPPSNTAPEVEGVLMSAMRKLLEVKHRTTANDKRPTLPGRDHAQLPNILLMTVDNLGYGDLGCYGSQTIKTPNMDRLAAQGVRCTDFYTASPTCTVSRACLLTGRVAQRHGLTRQLGGLEGNYGVGLRQSERLMPSFLKPLGYTTACFGKWNIGFAPGSRPTERGFDEFFGHASGNIDYYNHEYRGRLDLHRGTKPVRVEGYSTDLFADAACEFMRRHREEPFFVYLPFNAPHFPSAANKKPGQSIRWQAPEKYFKQYGLSPDEKDPLKRYRVVVTALDDAIGRVMKQLDSLGLKENTLVVLYSDNGAFKLGRKGLDVGSNALLRAGGVTLYEGGIRVACMVRWPGKITAGTVCREPLLSCDLLPMFVRAGGGTLPKEIILDGRDPTAALADKGNSPHEALFFKYHGYEAVRRGQYKLIRSAANKPFHLYDLNNDLGETTDLAADQPELVASLRESLERWLKDVYRSSTARKLK